MSAYLDYSLGEDVYTGGSAFGPQDDGTFVTPSEGIMSQPVDAGGGPPANYSGTVMDIFRFGVGVWSQTQARRDMIDQRRWEATNAGLFQQGQAAAMFGGKGQIGVLGVAAVGLILLLVLKD